MNHGAHTCHGVTNLEYCGKSKRKSVKRTTDAGNAQWASSIYPGIKVIHENI